MYLRGCVIISAGIGMRCQSVAAVYSRSTLYAPAGLFDKYMLQWISMHF